LPDVGEALLYPIRRTNMSDDITVSCPHCGSNDIAAYDTVKATAKVTGWRRCSDGSLEPEYGNGTDVDWNTQSPEDDAKPFGCTACDTLLSESELVIDSGEEDDDDTDDAVEADAPSITPEVRAVLRAERVARAKAEIRADIVAGKVPASVVRFSELHDHGDADCYGGIADDDDAQRLLALWGGPVQIGSMVDATPADLQAFYNEIQDEIDRWLIDGRPG
jgi:hypothetical protein